VGQEPHILFDATCVVPTGKGASVHALAVLAHLASMQLAVRMTALLREEMRGRTGPLAGVEFKHVAVGSSLLWRMWTLPAIVRQMRPSVLHIFGETPLGPVPVPFTLSVHELPHLYRKYSRSRPAGTREIASSLGNLLLPSTCRRAGGIVALSRSTASDLIRSYRVKPNRIGVAYPAADSRFFETNPDSNTRTLDALTKPYILTFATNDPRELPNHAIRAFVKVADRIPHCLVIAGRCPEALRTRLIDSVPSELSADRIHFTGFLRDEELPTLYRNSAVYLELSAYEGFGLQACEAMASGTPVIASNVSSLPEVVGDAGILVENGDTQKLASTIVSLVTDPQEAARRSALGRAQASKFSWPHCADETWRVIRGVIDEKKART